MKTIKFKKLNPNAIKPTRAYSTDAGFDLVATSRTYQGGCYVYGTGLAIEIPANHVGLIFPRSSISKIGLTLSNCVGVIDSSYRGEITFKFRPVNDHPMLYNVGDRIGQLIVLPYPEFKFIESDVLSSTDRGTGGYGSTGR